MKTLELIGLLALLTFSYGCSRDTEPDDSSYSRGYQSVRYRIGLNILDVYCNDKMKETVEADNFSFQLNAFQGKSDELRVLSILSYTEKGNDGYLILHSSTHPSKKIDMITYKLIFPFVFGDNKEHIIVSYWHPDESGTIDQICYRIELDGKEFPVTREPLLKYYNGVNDIEGTWSEVSVARIVLDR